MNKIQSFTDLEAWREAHKLVLMVYGATKKFPMDERSGLSLQLRRAAVSISSNVSEGFSRKSRKEKVQFYTISLASLREVQNQLLISKDIKYIDEKEFTAAADRSVRVSKLINGLIKSAQNK